MKRAGCGLLQWLMAAGLVLGCSAGHEDVVSQVDGGLDDAAEGAAPADCVLAGKACGSAADCCGGAQEPSLCIDFGGGSVCTDVCSKNSDCANGCCAPTNTSGVKVCAPSHCLAGIGTACLSDEECSSGVCYGFCSASCSTNAACSGGYGAGGSSNLYGNENWCVENAQGSDVCFPGCSVDSDCTLFNNATCMTNQDVGGAVRGICSTCVPSCSGKQCGPDGCGGSCGSCPSGASCTASGTCGCAPQCSGKQCGPNGCGGSCGACAVTSTCSSSGSCVCAPRCSGRQCGSDGCGGSCGSCSSGVSCSASGQCLQGFGNSCTGAGECASGICTHGFCSSCASDTGCGGSELCAGDGFGPNACSAPCTVGDTCPDGSFCCSLTDASGRSVGGCAGCRSQ